MLNYVSVICQSVPLSEARSCSGTLKIGTVAYYNILDMNSL